VLLVVAAIAGVGLPIYRVGSQGPVSTSAVQAQTDVETPDQDSVAVTSQTNSIQIPTRLTFHTNGTVSVWFQGQTDGVYRVDYADTKAASLTAMVWKVAADDLVAATDNWTEWVDTGATNRPSPGEVNERYYRVVSKTASNNLTVIATGATAQQLSTLSGTGTSNSQGATAITAGTNGGAESPTSVPTEILQLLQKQAALSQWSQSSTARNLAALQECEKLGELVAGGAATENTLIDSLASSKLRISMLMTLGRSLFRSGDRHHAQLFFEAIVQHHAKRATVRQKARCHLWLGRLHQDEGLQLKFIQRNPESANTEFQMGAADYLLAKDNSVDWIRGPGWLGAAVCYREMGDQVKRRNCLQQLIAEQSGTNSWVLTKKDLSVGPRMRDLANVLLATSYHEEGNWQKAAQVYQQMHDRLDAQFRNGSEEYRGQQQLSTSLIASINWCGVQHVASSISTNQANTRTLP
jgi:tetratricopeptide (TPR) repeat protein